MRLHVLTAVSRPANLPRVAESLAEAVVRAPNVQVAWHWRLDLDREHVGGQALKNEMLEGISDGWVYVLDDDTTMHPDLLARFSEEVERNSGLEVLIVAQHRNGREVLQANPAHVIPGMIDMGQALLRRDLIGQARIPDDYNGDGMFLNVLVREAGCAGFLNEVLSLHNAISGVEVSV